MTHTTSTTETESSKPAARARVALVTGAGRRIGRAIALGMAEAGWDIAVHYRQSRIDAEQVADAVRALGRRALLLPCDLAIESAVRAMPASVVDQLGHLDRIVNNASLFEYD